MAQEHEQPKRKKHRGPTKMKNIAKDPNVRERVEFNGRGQAIGPRSVTLSSYIGTLVREHVPFTISDWRKVSDELKTVLWKSVQVKFLYITRLFHYLLNACMLMLSQSIVCNFIQARFEVDEEYQKNYIMVTMGCNWRSSKSRLVSPIRSKSTNQERMNLRPPNITPPEWRKFVKLKTSKEFAAVSESYKARRRKQIPYTCSRKGMVRLEEELVTSTT